MNPDKLKKIFALMKSYGVEYFKNDELEIKMSSTEKATEPVLVKSEDPKTKKRKAVPSQAIPPVESIIPHHPNEVAGLLRLDDNELVEKLFPDFSKMGGN